MYSDVLVSTSEPKTTDPSIHLAEYVIAIDRHGSHIDMVRPDPTTRHALYHTLQLSLTGTSQSYINQREEEKIRDTQNETITQ